MKYYSVKVKMGHMGTGNYIPVTVYVQAEDMFSAMKKAQKLPAVKHDKTPLLAKEITKEEYDIGLLNNEYSAFMNAKFNKGDNIEV